MKLIANAGLQWDKAILEYLIQGRHEVERKVGPFWNGVSPTYPPPTYLTHPTYLMPVKSPACQPWLRIARRPACARHTGCVVPTRTCQREGMG